MYSPALNAIGLWRLAVMSDMQKKVTRRAFALGTAVAATSVLVPGSAVLGQAPADPQSSTSTSLSSEAQAEVDGKVKEIFRKHGGKLSDEQKADIRKVMAETQSGLEKMRAFALDNGDQPATVLKFIQEEKKNAQAE
jgi:hypothetical protein